MFFLSVDPALRLSYFLTRREAALQVLYVGLVYAALAPIEARRRVARQPGGSRGHGHATCGGDRDHDDARARRAVDLEALRHRPHRRAHILGEQARLSRAARPRARTSPARRNRDDRARRRSRPLQGSQRPLRPSSRKATPHCSVSRGYSTRASAKSTRPHVSVARSSR